MTDTEALLSVTSSKSGDEITLHLNTAGIDVLINELNRLRRHLGKDACEHFHLFSPTWGLDELTESMLDMERKDGHRQAHHIKAYAWTDEWKKKLEL